MSATMPDLLGRYCGRCKNWQFKSEGPCGAAVITSIAFQMHDGTIEGWRTNDGGQTYEPIARSMKIIDTKEGT